MQLTKTSAFFWKVDGGVEVVDFENKTKTKTYGMTNTSKLGGEISGRHFRSTRKWTNYLAHGL